MRSIRERSPAHAVVEGVDQPGLGGREEIALSESYPELVPKFSGERILFLGTVLTLRMHNAET